MKISNVVIEPRALLAELVGTFALASVAILVGNPLLVGLSLLALVTVFGAISGTHLNPAISFGLWSVKKLETIKLPFYWAAQFLGALLSLIVIQQFKNTDFGLSLASFGNFNGLLFAAELIGMAIFSLGVAAVIHRRVEESSKGLVIGLSLMAGLFIGGGLLDAASQNPDLATSKDKSAQRVLKVEGAVLNPAIALSATEKVDAAPADLLATTQSKTTQPASRFTWETLLGSLIGAALGFNLYFLLAGVSVFTPKAANAKATVGTKVTTVKKITKKVSRNKK